MKISVALCTFNGERFIREQIESILNQTLPVDEIVVCDDGSTDNTLQIIDNYQDTTSTNIRIYHNERRLGVCNNFQKAINQCHGDLIFLSDQDDIWANNKTAIICSFFENNTSIDVVFTNAKLIQGNGDLTNEQLWDYTFHSYYRKQFVHHLEFECFIVCNHATGATMAIRKRFAQNNQFAKKCTKGFLHDHVIALQAAMENKLSFINLCLIDYRIHPEQQCGILAGTKNEPAKNYLSPLSPDPIAYQSLTNPFFKDRADFWAHRFRIKHEIHSPLYILSKIKLYKRFYGKNYNKVMDFDIRACIKYSLKKILK